MAYNVKLSGEEIEYLAVVVYKAATGECYQLAQTFSTIMARSPRMWDRYQELYQAGQVCPAKTRGGR